MNTGIPIDRLLRWRQAEAEAEAPPAPRAARLLELSRPWWEQWPKEFLAAVERLGKVQVGLGHAMDEPGQGRHGHPVPVLVVVGRDQAEAQARMLYFSVRQGQLRLRFQLDGPAQKDHQEFEVTFLCNASLRPVTTGSAAPSVDGEFRVETGLPPDLAREWERLKVTDRMPFRFILRADTGGG